MEPRIWKTVYDWALLSVYFYGVISFFALFFISAPYGRHFRKGWGWSLPAKAAWILMELPAFGVILAFFLFNGSWTSPVLTVFIVIWEIHYIQRTFIYPLLLKSPGKPFPLLLLVLGFLFNAMNGYINGYYLFQSGAPYPPDWLYSPQFIIGTALFFTGYGINLQSDATLRGLKETGPGDYRIPGGGFFRFVSCPNYLGEILEWCGFAVLTWSQAGLAFAFFTFCNLAPRALSNHKWYREVFPAYPASRKALIPFLW